MKYSASFLLLLAFIASNCNGQVQNPPRPNSQPGPRPGNPGAPSRPAPNGQTPPSRPGPNGQTPNRPAPNAPPTRPNAQQNPRQPPQNSRPVPVPNTPPTRPNPQQNPRPPPSPNTTTRSPAVNNGPPSPRPPTPGANNPGASPPNPGVSPPPAGGQTTTTRTTTLAPSTTRNPDSPLVTNHPDSFPTLPNIAPAPPVHFPGPDDNIIRTPSLPHPPSHPVGRVDPRCPRVADSRNPVHLPHESNCNKFFRCGDNGVVMEHSCPDGLHWNAQRNFCDFPGNAGCQSGNAMPRPQPMPNPNHGFVNPIVIPMAPRN